MSQKGSVTVGIVAATFGCMLVGLIFVSIVGIYLGNQSADTAASAASLAGLRALREPVMDEGEAETQERILAFWGEVDLAVGGRVSEWEAKYWERRREELEQQQPSPDSDEIDRLIRDEISSLRPGVAESYRRGEVWTRKPRIAGELLAGRPLPLSVRLEEFLTAGDRGCLLVRAAAAHQGDMDAAAARFARENGSELVQNLHFSAQSRGQVEATVRRRVRLAIYDHMLPAERRYLQQTGVAYLDNLAGLPIEFPVGCRKE